MTCQESVCVGIPTGVPRNKGLKYILVGEEVCDSPTLRVIPRSFEKEYFSLP